MAGVTALQTSHLRRSDNERIHTVAVPDATDTLTVGKSVPRQYLPGKTCGEQQAARKGRKLNATYRRPPL
jgi:hypothetical protein